MQAPSELQLLLEQQASEGQLDSTGKFTIARERALGRLAEFQLPRSTAWICKIVQSAVAAGSSGIAVRQTSKEIFISFESPSSWTMDFLEAEIFEPEVSAEPALDHLKRGLWPIAIHEKRPFRLSLPGQNSAIFWDGQRPRRLPAKPGRFLEITVSQQSPAGGLLPFLGAIEAARQNAALSKELYDHCFTCPIALNLDGRRLDALQGCPHLGFSPTTYPIRMGFARAEQMPTFVIPPRTLKGYVPLETGDTKLQTIFESSITVPSQVNVATMVSAGVEKSLVGKATTLKPLLRPSKLFWVRDGVVIDWEDLNFPMLSVAVGLYASAAGLETDLSGFGLISSPALTQRRQSARKAALPIVLGAQVSLDIFVRSVLQQAYAIGAILLAGGLSVATANPAPGLILASGGLIGGVAVTNAVNQSAEKELERNLQRSLEQIKRCCKQAWS